MQKSIQLFILFLLPSLCIYSQSTFVFVGSYNYDKNKEGIYVYELDSITGNLKKVSSINQILNPSFITLSQDGNLLFSCTDTRTPKDGSVSSFRFNSTFKSITFINQQKTNGENPVYLILDKSEKWLLNANYKDGSVSVYPIDKDGSIAPISQFIHFTDSSVNKKRQEGSHIHATIFSPDYTYVFLPDLGADKIRCFAFDSLQTQPLQTSKPTFAKSISGCGPRHFTFHPNGKTAYCIEELSGTINVYNYKDGKLDSIQRIATHHKNDSFEFSSADLHISPDGKYLYASNRGEENNIAIFSIKKNGTLKSKGYQSTFGKTPRNFAIDETGKFLIVANQSTGNIVVFKRNLKTGFLVRVGNDINIENPTCVQIKNYSK